MQIDYPFAWLDDLIELKLCPRFTDLSGEDIMRLDHDLPQQFRLVEQDLRRRTFGLTDASELETIVRHYTASFEHLRRHAHANLLATGGNDHLSNANQLVLSLFEEFRLRLLQRYPSSWLDVPAFVPALAKLLIKLSGDQIAIIARAAFIAGRLDATSMREAYRLITPHVRTELMPELSDESLRSHAGQPEQKDLDIAAEVLRELADIIDDPKRYFGGR